MDEILIDEKRYVSSKQAAKVTGYAKDYIGQLCREGRVPARLVGRSWYVLESAIQDHRFGTQDSEGVSTIETKETAQKMPTKTWEFPRYEATHDEVLPSVNRLRDVEPDSEDHEGLECRGGGERREARDLAAGAGHARRVGRALVVVQTIRHRLESRTLGRSSRHCGGHREESHERESDSHEGYSEPHGFLRELRDGFQRTCPL